MTGKLESERECKKSEKNSGQWLITLQCKGGLQKSEDGERGYV